MFKRILSILAISIATLALAGKSGKQIAVPDKDNSPSISQIRKPLPVDRPIKVIVSCLLPGSAANIQIDTAKGLSLLKDENGNPQYDVTLTIAKDREVTTSETLHIYYSPFSIADLDIDVTGKSFDESFG